MAGAECLLVQVLPVRVVGGVARWEMSAVQVLQAQAWQVLDVGGVPGGNVCGAGVAGAGVAGAAVGGVPEWEWCRALQVQVLPVPASQVRNVCWRRCCRCGCWWSPGVAGTVCGAGVAGAGMFAGCRSSQVQLLAESQVGMSAVQASQVTALPVRVLAVSQVQV